MFIQFLNGMFYSFKFSRTSEETVTSGVKINSQEVHKQFKYSAQHLVELSIVLPTLEWSLAHEKFFGRVF